MFVTALTWTMAAAELDSEEWETRRLMDALANVDKSIKACGVSNIDEETQSEVANVPVCASITKCGEGSPSVNMGTKFEGPLCTSVMLASI